MATDDFGGVFDPGSMTDDELYDLIVQQLGEYPNVDADWIDVTVRDGRVTLSGRVGAEMEKQVAEKVVVEIIGVRDFANELVVSELHRYQAPEAADEAVTEDEEIEDQMGEPDPNQSDTAEHLVEDLEEEAYGTHDMHAAIRDGVPYTPPDRPIADGYDSEEDH